VLYAIFMIYPFFQSIYLSFTDWNGAEPVKNFIGLENYRNLLTDSLLWKSLRNNVIWVVIGTLGPLALGFLLAVLLASRPKGFTLFRTAYFMPQVLSPVVIGIVWGWMYNPLFGIFNVALERVGLESWSRGWLGDPDWALYAVLLAAMWAETGFVFVVFLAGLQNVSRFDIIFVMTGGGPANATEVVATYAYSEAFTQNNVGYASTLTLVITIITLIASVIFMRLRERGED
jgi:ABC-type sugar transport system permease subunit